MRSGEIFASLWQVTATSLVVVLLATVVLLNLTPMYKATAYIKKQSPDRLLTVSSAGFLGSFFDKNYVDWEERLSGTPGGIGTPVEGTLTRQQIVSFLREGLQVTGFPDSTHISFTSSDPRFAAEVVNLIAHEYLVSVSETADEELQVTNELLNAAEKLLFEQLQITPPALLHSESERIGQSWASTNRRLLANRESILEKQTAVRKWRRALDDSSGFDSGLLSGPNVSHLADRLETLKIRWREMEIRYGPRHAVMESLATELDQTEQLLRARVSEAALRAENELESLQEEASALEKQLKELRAAESDVISHQLKIDGLRQQVDTARRNFDVAKQSTRKQETPAFSEASIPREPIYPRVMLMQIQIFLVSMVVLFMLRYAVIKMNNTHQVVEKHE